MNGTPNRPIPRNVFYSLFLLKSLIVRPSHSDFSIQYLLCQPLAPPFVRGIQAMTIKLATVSEKASYAANVTAATPIPHARTEWYIHFDQRYYGVYTVSVSLSHCPVLLKTCQYPLGHHLPTAKRFTSKQKRSYVYI